MHTTATSGLVVPLLPFGMPKYDAGERFDLRSPYADDGWVVSALHCDEKGVRGVKHCCSGSNAAAALFCYSGTQGSSGPQMQVLA